MVMYLKRLLILGAGGHGKVVADVARSMNEWEEICFLDNDVSKIGKYINGIKVIGKFDEIEKLKEKFDYGFVAVGKNDLRLNLMEELKVKGFKIPILIHRFSCISSSVEIGEGTVIMPGAVINVNTKIGKGCIINTSSSIDHDCVIGDGVHISPGVHIAGTVSVGLKTWICIGANVINNVNIGKNVIVAAGSTVINDVENNVLVAGVPAKFKKRLE